MNQDKIINNISKAFDLIGGKYNLDSNEINDIKSNLKSKNVGFQTGGYKEISNKIYSQAKELFPNKVNHHFSGGEKDYPCTGLFACTLPGRHQKSRARCLSKRNKRTRKKLGCKWEPEQAKSNTETSTVTKEVNLDDKGPKNLSKQEPTCYGPRDCTSDKAKKSKGSCLSRGFNPKTRNTDCKWGVPQPAAPILIPSVDKASSPTNISEMKEKSMKKMKELNTLSSKLEETTNELEKKVTTPVTNMNKSLENKINQEKAQLKELQSICKIDYKRMVDNLFEKTRVKGPKVLDLKQSLKDARNELMRVNGKCKSKAAQGNETKTNLQNIMNYLNLIENNIKIEENQQKAAEDKRIANEKAEKEKKEKEQKAEAEKLEAEKRNQKK